LEEEVEDFFSLSSNLEIQTVHAQLSHKDGCNFCIMVYRRGQSDKGCNLIWSGRFSVGKWRFDFFAVQRMYAFFGIWLFQFFVNNPYSFSFPPSFKPIFSRFIVIQE